MLWFYKSLRLIVLDYSFLFFKQTPVIVCEIFFFDRTSEYMQTNKHAILK